MANPTRFKEDVPGHYGLSIEVDVKKCDCRRGEPAHCHLCKNGVRIAQICVRPIYWTNETEDINNSTKKDVEDFVRRYEDEIFFTYTWNSENGADY